MNKRIDKKDWKMTAFGEMCKNLNASERDPLSNGIERYIGLEHIETNNLHIKTWGKIAEGTTFTKRFTKGHVLFGKRRSYLRKAAVADFDGLCSGDILVFEANTKVIDPNLFPFIVSSDRFFEHAIQTSAGSLSPRTKFQDLAKLEFLLPPKDEQRKLANLLWAADHVVDKYYELLNQLVNFKYNITKRLLNSEIIIVANKIKKKQNGEWSRIKLGDVSIIKGRIGWRGLKQSEYTSDGPFLIANKHITDGKVLWEKCDHINEIRYNESTEIALENGDIIFSKDGVLGNPAIIENLDFKATINSTMMLVRPIKELNSYYLFQLLKSYLFDNLIRERVSGTTIPHLFQADMKEFVIPFPSKKEQSQISDYFENVDNKIRSVKHQINLSRNLMKQLINQIFSM